MAYPIPGSSITTPYGKRGGMWSCDENSSGGVHTGVDFAVALGTRIYAPISGDIRHRDYGTTYFGTHQFAISPDDNEPFGSGEVFFAHTRTRLADGTRVNLGDFIAEVGKEGNVSGPHLHMEYMPNTKGVWYCGCHANPQPVLDYQADSGGGDVYPIPSSKTVYLSKLRFGQDDSDSVWHLQDVLNGHPLTGGATLPLTGGYFSMTDAEVIKCQVQHGFGADPPGASFVGEGQARHLFDGKGYTLVYDI